MLKKVFRYTAITLTAVLGLIMLTWVALLTYVNLNEDELIAKASTAIQKRTNGEVKIEGLSVSFFRTFPILSLQLEDVVLRDSLYYKHKQDLFQASDVYLRASLPGLISGSQLIGKVVIRNGAINLVTDSSGGTNEYVLKSDNKQGGGKASSIPDVELKNVNISLQNTKRNKSYQAFARSLVCAPKQKGETIDFRLNLKMQVKNIAFNKKRGSYLRDKGVEGKFILRYEGNTKELSFNDAHIELNEHPYLFNGKFNLSKDNSDFKLSISSKKVTYSEATALLTEILQKKLDDYDISKPIDVDVELSGQTSVQDSPLILAKVKVKNGDIKTPFANFKNCSFDGIYTNEMVENAERTDENSLLHFSGFKGTWQEIPVISKNIKIINLITPVLECDINTDVELKALNTLTGTSTLQFISGKGNIDIDFKGPLVKTDTVVSNIDGEIKISNASLRYNPRNFMLTNCGGTFKFQNNNLQVNKLSAKVGTTELVMNGNAENFLSMLQKSPEKLILNWNITTPKLNLQDFKSFLSRSKEEKKDNKKATFGSAASKVDKMFAEGDMYIQLNAPTIEYKSFLATDLKANVVLKPAQIAFQQVQLKHAGGSMDVSGSLNNGEVVNPVTLRAVLRDMNIPKLFEAFENFGQDAITHDNLKGKLSAEVDFKTSIDNNAKLISQANDGFINFLLQDGELNNFEPLMEVSKKALKKQDFTNIRFADLANRLDVKGTAFIINHMDIRSTALNISVEGVYDFKKGTDMSIRFPLTNLTKSQENTDIGDFGKVKKGVGLRLRAKTGDDGKLKITWDPFKRAIKNKGEVEDSTQRGN